MIHPDKAYFYLWLELETYNFPCQRPVKGIIKTTKAP
jgi:hypothetical protein